MELSEFLAILANTLAIVAGMWICLVVFVCLTMKRGEKVPDMSLVLAGVGAAYLIALLVHYVT
jgi:hypothetical protein